MINREQNYEMALDCFLLAGRIMMESGAETYRVEDTMLRMARSQNIDDAQSYVTPTGIMLSLGKRQITKITSISTRITDLHKIVLVNSVSRNLTTKIITLEEAYDELLKIQNTNYFLPVYLQILTASIASSSFLILFGGRWSDMPEAFVAGGIGYFVVTVMQEMTKVKFFSEFVAALVIGILTQIAVVFGLGTEVDKIIIGSVMPLVPGLLITNAVRDLMAGHFTAGIAKGAEALLTAFAIGSGIALALAFKGEKKKMEYVVHALFSFIATACFGVLFNAPTRVIPYGGLVGSVGWMIYYVLMQQQHVTEVQASFISAFFIAILAQIFARRFKIPMIIFNVSGIISLVPGGIAYNTTRNIMELDYIMGIQNGMRAFMISGAIAMGLVFAEVIVQLFMRILKTGKTSMQTFAKAKRQRIDK